MDSKDTPWAYCRHKKLDIPVRGSLEGYSLADILIGLQRGGKTGVLKVENDTVIKNIYKRRRYGFLFVKSGQ